MLSTDGDGGPGASNTNAAKNSLSTLKLRQNQLEEDLRQVERQIYELEEHYIERTQAYGNVVKGWEGFLNYRIQKPGLPQRRTRIARADRIFSNSSVSAPLVSTCDGDGKVLGLGWMMEMAMG